MKQILKLSCLLIALTVFAGKAKAQTFDLVITGPSCTTLLMDIIGPGGVMLYNSIPVTTGTTTCLTYPAGSPPTQLIIREGGCNAGGIPVNSGGTFPICSWAGGGCVTGCSCLVGSRTVSTSYSTGTGTVCPPTADVLTVTVN